MYRRTSSKYRSRDHYRGELALHNAELRKAQPRRTRKAKERTAEHQAMLDLSAQMRRVQLSGERIPDEMRAEYSRLLKIHQAQLAAQ